VSLNFSFEKIDNKFNGGLIRTPTSTNHDNKRIARRVHFMHRLSLSALHGMDPTDKIIANVLTK
jgi:hypothetical protein